MNLAILIGRLGRDPELKTTSTGENVCDFSLATNEKVPKGKGREEIVTWHRIVAWNELAKHAAKLRKGQMVMVQGSLHTDHWQDKHGNKRETLQLVCQRLTPIGGEES